MDSSFGWKSVYPASTGFNILSQLIWIYTVLKKYNSVVIRSNMVLGFTDDHNEYSPVNFELT